MRAVDSVSWRPSFQLFARSAVLLLAVAVLAMLVMQKWRGASVLSAFLVLSLLVVSSRRVPPLVAALFMSAALFDVAGYALNLYRRFALYDEVAHFYNGFAVTLALGVVLLGGVFGRLQKHPLLLLVVMTSLGLGIGVAWELSEWLADAFLGTDLLGPQRDTLMDLAMDGAGAVLAGVLATQIPALHEHK